MYGKEEVEVVWIKSAWLALRVDARLCNIKSNSFLSKLTLELRLFERVCALIIFFLFGECSQQSVVCAAEEN